MMKQPGKPTKQNKLCRRLLAGCSLVVLSATSVQAQIGVEDAVLNALESNPELQVRWHEFRSAGYAAEAAHGNFRPQLSVNAAYGRQHENFITGSSARTGFAEIAMTQLLWDGGRTEANAAEFSDIELVRYFELLQKAETTALETVRAYLDVLRFRELVRRAEDNLETHREVYEQIAESAEAGVARSADLEQINGRLALAEANLINEQTNLHDVSARYLRITGDMPPHRLRDVEFNTGLPATVDEALMQAYRHSPKFRATLRNISAAESSLSAQRAEKKPQVNLTARYGVDTRNDFGVRENHTDGRIGLELTYDFYTGGRNTANVSRAAALKDSAMSLRDRACVDIRQEVQIAFNDLQRIKERLPIQNQHRLSSDRVRTAYRQQFEIGQRTLLDVLDSENEFFEASRTWTNSSFDKTQAAARTLAAMGLLVETLSVHRSDIPSLNELDAEPMQVDPATACPMPDGQPSPAMSRRAGGIKSSNPPAESEQPVSVPTAVEATVSNMIREADALAQSERNHSEFTLQLGSFSVEANANRLVDQLRALDHDAFVLQTEVDSQSIWVVQVRAPGGKNDAIALKRELRDQTGLDCVIVSRPV